MVHTGLHALDRFFTALHAIPPLDHGLEEANFASGDMVTVSRTPSSSRILGPPDLSADSSACFHFVAMR